MNNYHNLSLCCSSYLLELGTLWPIQPASVTVGSNGVSHPELFDYTVSEILVLPPIGGAAVLTVITTTITTTNTKKKKFCHILKKKVCTLGGAGVSRRGVTRQAAPLAAGCNPGGAPRLVGGVT